MKSRILPLTTGLLTVVLATGCLNKTTPTPSVLPTGNFIGTFTRLHLNTANNKIDTITATLTLTMSQANGYAIGGDTTYHAASHGGYVSDGSNIAFSDQTLPSSSATNAPAPTKTHLNGVYQYVFTQGSSIQMQQIGDTLAFYYNMKAQ